MIYEMFWTSDIKDIAERHIILKIDHKGRTPSSILYGVDLEDIQVNFFILSFVQYTHYMNAYKVLEVKAHQNGNRARVLEYT